MLISDKLINNCKLKKGSAQKQLFELLLPYLNTICKRYLYYPEELEDTLQEAFINIFTNIDKFDSERGQFKTWAVKITINSCLKCNYKLAKMDTREFDTEQHGQIITQETLNKLSIEELLLFLKKMPDKYYDVFNLYIIDGFSHREIADILKIDESSSRQRLSRARKWLSSKSEHIDYIVYGAKALLKAN